MKVLHVVGARPNFMKVAPVFRALEEKTGVAQLLIHTGQHYDPEMSGIFFAELGIPMPDINLDVGSGSHAAQTAQVMTRLEPIIEEKKPDLVLVYGDVNSTLAASLVSAKLSIPVGHVEAGLRSFDRSMPEEINRILTDQISDLLFTPSSDGSDNLIHEGISTEKIHFVGNVMIDTLVRLLPKAQWRWDDLRSMLNIHEGEYCLVTLHRPSNVDDRGILKEIVRALNELSNEVVVVFPIHPRTQHRLEALDINDEKPTMKLVKPLGYLDFLCLQKHSKFVITDSGGIQEETTFMGIPCLTVRENTERPITIAKGTNRLVGRDMNRIKSEATRILENHIPTGEIPPLWDGRAGERIADAIVNHF